MTLAFRLHKQTILKHDQYRPQGKEEDCYEDWNRAHRQGGGIGSRVYFSRNHRSEVRGLAARPDLESTWNVLGHTMGWLSRGKFDMGTYFATFLHSSQKLSKYPNGMLQKGIRHSSKAHMICIAFFGFTNKQS